MTLQTYAIIALVALVGLAITGFVLWDRQRARWSDVREWLRLYVVKARMDRNYYARIPAELLVRWLKLDERAIKDPAAHKPDKQHRHPAAKR